MKRFWQDATAEAGEGGYAILLDGKPLRLPGGTALLVGPAPLAEAIAAEWRAARTEMSYADTPLTRLAGTASVRIAPNPFPTADAIARYGESDLLCYRAEAPEELVARQAAVWQPWLDWAAERYGAPMRVTNGIAPLRQHRTTVAALRAAVGAFDPYALAALGIAVPALGSLVLGLALAERQIGAEEAYRAGALDELFQAEKWGEDTEAAARRAAVAADIALAGRMLHLVSRQ